MCEKGVYSRMIEEKLSCASYRAVNNDLLRMSLKFVNAELCAVYKDLNKLGYKSWARVCGGFSFRGS